jgi:hypothetical protein
MEPEDREDGGELVDVELDEETLAHCEARAQASGRTLEEQINYELRVNHELSPPDPGDQEAAQRGELFSRMRNGDTLNG